MDFSSIFSELVWASDSAGHIHPSGMQLLHSVCHIVRSQPTSQEPASLGNLLGRLKVCPVKLLPAAAYNPIHKHPFHRPALQGCIHIEFEAITT